MNFFGFVVIGRNEGPRLAQCLEAIRVHGAPMVYADSGSDDGSPDLAERMGAFVVRMNPAQPMNASRGRREGLAALLEQFPGCQAVQFIDGDCRLAPGWIERATLFMAEHARAAVVCGRRFEANPNASFYNRMCDEEWNTPCGKVDASGGDALMRVAAIAAVGSFDPTLMANEEPELAARLRNADWEIWRIDQPMTEHDAAIFSYRAYWRRALRGGFGLWQTWRRTAHLKQPIGLRPLLSAILWMVALPLAVIGLAVLAQSPIVLVALPIIYLLQITRMAARRGVTRWFHWRASALILSIKSAELLGALRAALSKPKHSAIEYKGR